MTVISVALGRTFHYVDEILPFRYFLCFFNLFINYVIWLGHTRKVNMKQYDEHCIGYKFETDLPCYFSTWLNLWPTIKQFYHKYNIKFLWNTILIICKEGNQLILCDAEMSLVWPTSVFYMNIITFFYAFFWICSVWNHVAWKHNLTIWSD